MPLIFKNYSYFLIFSQFLNGLHFTFLCILLLFLYIIIINDHLIREKFIIKDALSIYSILVKYDFPNYTRYFHISEKIEIFYPNSEYILRSCKLEII